MKMQNSLSFINILCFCKILFLLFLTNISFKLHLNWETSYIFPCSLNYLFIKWAFLIKHLKFP